jgi:hypothetical protein
MIAAGPRELSLKRWSERQLLRRTAKSPGRTMAGKPQINDLGSMKKLRLLSLVGIISIALVQAGWARGGGGGGGGFGGGGGGHFGGAAHFGGGGRFGGGGFGGPGFSSFGRGRPVGSSFRSTRGFGRQQNQFRSARSNERAFGARNHVFARHAGNWHQGWDRRHAHFWNGNWWRFDDGGWIGFDAGFYPWDDFPYYPYGYYPYGYYPYGYYPGY